MLQIGVFLALAFSILIAIFAVQNTTQVAVSFLGIRFEQVAVSVLVLVSAALGAGAIMLLGMAREVRWRLRQRALSQQLKIAQTRLRELESAAVVPEAEPSPELALPPAPERDPAPS
jgi:lipopolysaccharide assembly protein A